MLPEAYWTNLDWRSIGTALVAILGIGLPFISSVYRDWKTGRTSATASNVQVAETAAARQDRINREQYERVEKERQYHADLAQANADALAVAHREGRGMEDWAHWYRHGWINMQQRFSSLLLLADKVLAGEIAPERARTNYDQIRVTLPAEPPSVPLLAEAFEQKPPRS